MKLKHLICLGFLCAGCASAPQEKPRTLALFALLDDGQKVKEDTKLTAGAELELPLEGRGAPSTVLVVAYGDGGSDSPPQISPQLVPLTPGQQHLVHYQLDPKMKDGRLYVAVLAQGSPEEKEVATLIQDWKKSPQSGARTVIQDRLSDWMDHQDQELKHIGQVPADLGGVRLVSAEAANPSAGGSISQEEGNAPQQAPQAPNKEKKEQSLRWQEAADSVGTSAGQPGVFSYPIRFAKR